MKKTDMSFNRSFREIFNPEALEELVVDELRFNLDICEDPALARALHVVIAHYSIPGTYMEGAYDG